jgi:putative ABC transport system ATP-binding protein/ATP-binding cassette subfamily C protein CydD
MMLELNEVLLEGEPQTLSLMAHEGELTCLTGGSSERLTRWLLAMLGFEHVKSGYISLDGEPLTPQSVAIFRSMMAYAPSQLEPIGQVTCYTPPTAQDVFGLKANRNLPVSNSILDEEMRHICPNHADNRVQLLAVASLLGRPILLVDNPLPQSIDYLHQQAAQGRTVVLTSQEAMVTGAANQIVEL